MPNLRPEVRRSGWRLIRICMSLTAFTLAWLGASTSYLPPNSQHEESTAASTVDAVVERIIDVESGGDPNAKNRRSSATGLGQFLDETWLDMIRAHRPVGQLHRSAQAARSCADTPLVRGVQRRRNALPFFAPSRSAYAADNPIPINIRTASERDGWPGSPLRHSSISCRHSSASRKLTTGICPIRGRPRFFRIT
jgi:hypothetical protein